MEVDHWGIEQEEHNESPLASVLQYNTSSNQFLKQAAIIYAATTDIIGLETARGPSAPIAFYGAFVTALSQKGKHSAETLGALCYLLARIYPLVPANVLAARVEVVADLFLDILKRHAEIVYVTKNLLFCISKQLRVTSPKLLSSKAAVKMMQALFVFSVDPRPKIRRDAQINCVNVFTHFSEQSTKGLPKALTDEFIAFVEHELSQCSRTDCQSALHLCGLLKDVIGHISTVPMAKIVAPLLQLAAEGNSVMLLQTFTVLSQAFSKSFAKSVVLATPTDVSNTLAQSLNLTSVDIEARVSRDADFIENILASISDLKPNLADVHGNKAFAGTYKTGYTTLFALAPLKALKRVNATFTILADSFTADKVQVAYAAGAALRAVVRTSITNETVSQAAQSAEHPLHQLFAQVQSLFSMAFRPSWLQSLAVAQAAAAACKSTPAASLLTPLLQVVDGLHRSADNKDIQIGAERVIGSALQALGPEVVLSILPLGLPVPHESFTVAQQLTESRPWMLPLIAHNVKYSTLGFFTDNFLPAADSLIELTAAALSTIPSRPAEARTCLTLAEQVWDTLPAFATVPTDLTKNFKRLAKKLMEYMQNDDTAFAQPVVCKALKLLVSKNVAIAEGRWMQGNDLGMNRITLDDDDDTPAAKPKAIAAAPVNAKKNIDQVDENYDDVEVKEKEVDVLEEKDTETVEPCPISVEEAIENVKVLGQLSKNILPLLFNLASTSLATYRVVVLDAILAYTHVADASVKSSLFKRALEKFVESTKELNEAHVKLEEQNNADSDEEEPASIFDTKDMITVEEIRTISDTAKALTDILISMAPALDQSCLELLLRAVIAHFNSADHGMQKKAYQAVSHIIVINQQVFNAFWSETIRALTVSATNILPGAFKARILCAMTVYSHIDNIFGHKQVVETLPSILAETILATKDGNSKTRDAAYQLVITLGKRVFAMEPVAGQGNTVLSEYMFMVAAGLVATTPRMKSATVTILARLIYEFRSALPQQLVAELFSSIMVLLQSRTREIIKAVLGFVKVSILALDDHEIKPVVKDMLNAFSNMPNEIKSRFKRKVRTLFTILMRKFGVDYIRTVVPTADVRLVDYLRKMIVKQQKMKEQAFKDKKKGSMDDKDEDDDVEGVKLHAGMTFEEMILGDDDDEESENYGGTMSAADLLQAQVNQQKKRKQKTADDDKMVWLGDDTDFMEATALQKAQKAGINVAEADAAASARKKRRHVPETKEGKMDIASLQSLMDDEEKEANIRAKQKAEDPRLLKQQAQDARAKALKEKHSESIKASVGKAYASDSAGGDARRKGQAHDPFAYMPLDPRTLNKRKKAAHVQSAAYDAAFVDRKQGKQMGQKLNKKQRLAIRVKGGRN